MASMDQYAVNDITFLATCVNVSRTVANVETRHAEAPQALKNPKPQKTSADDDVGEGH